MRNKAKKGAAVTHEEVTQAIAKFRREGGLIKKLPDEVTPINTAVGGKWSIYESISDTGSGSVEAPN
jgi:hypothetical protein